MYSVPYKPKINAIESWFSQFKHYFVINIPSISFQELKKFVKKTIRKTPKTSYFNYMKYAYVEKTYYKRTSTQRRGLKKYKK